MSKLKRKHLSCENNVTVTLLMAAVYRCNSCDMYTVTIDQMKRHQRVSHAATAGEDEAPVGPSGGKTSDGVTGFSNRLSCILQEVQNLESVKSLVKSQLNVRLVSESVQIEKENRISDRQLRKKNAAISNALKLLLAESQAVTVKKEDGDKLPKVAEQSAPPNQPMSSDLAKAEVASELRSPSIAENRNQEERDKNADDIDVPYPVKLDIDQAYQTLMEAAKLMNDNDMKVEAEGKSAPEGGNIVAMPRFIDGVSNEESLRQESVAASQEFGHVVTEQRVDSQSVSNSEIPKHSNGMTDTLQLDDRSLNEVFKDARRLVERSKDNIENREKLAAREEDVTDEVVPMVSSNPLVPAGMTKQTTSKIYGNEDFEAIARTASKSNPDATTITVFQHTGDDRPPTTIHFKKSTKSDAIIPTGKSLGITSPFVRREYAGSKIFACQECHSRYKTQNELDRHITKKHKKSRSYLCEICGDALATQSGMKIHIVRMHGDSSMLTCTACNYATRSPLRLSIHVKKHDKTTSEFRCEPCKKSFVTESKLQQHNNSPVHKNAMDPIICEHCGYVVKKRDNFLVHLRKHTGEKPYKCKLCEYAAADGSTLKRHVMARHSSIRPFRCSQCNFSSVDKKGLTIHMRKHTGERPYTCDVCPYAAKRMGALTVHRRTHLRDKFPSGRSREENQMHGVEVASYVDITDIPISQVPYTTVTPSTGVSGQLAVSAQEPVESNAVSMAVECQVMAVDPSTAIPVQEVIVAPDSNSSVRALLQTMS